MSKRVAASRVHAHRVGLALSPEQYGARIGVSGMTVRRVEQGYQPFRSTQGKFARDMRIEVTDLWPLALDRHPRRPMPSAAPALAQVAA
jgi:hypothetical protein